MSKYYYVYRISNIKIKKYYYGYRSTVVPPYEDIGIKYFSSSTDKEFIKDQKENPTDYKYKVVQIFNTSKQALNLEIKLHNKFKVGANERFYNKVQQTNLGFDNTGAVHSEETKSKISESNKDKCKGRKASTETREKLSKVRKGRISNRKGCTLSDDQKKKLSIALIGNTNSKGNKPSEETRLKLSKATTGSNNPKAKIANVYEYHTNTLIAENVTLKTWCKENNYDQACLSRTTKSDHNLPNNYKTNIHKHKGVYARYIN